MWGSALPLLPSCCARPLRGRPPIPRRAAPKTHITPQARGPALMQGIATGSHGRRACDDDALRLRPQQRPRRGGARGRARRAYSVIQPSSSRGSAAMDPLSFSRSRGRAGGKRTWEVLKAHPHVVGLHFAAVMGCHPWKSFLRCARAQRRTPCRGGGVPVHVRECGTYQRVGGPRGRPRRPGALSLSYEPRRAQARRGRMRGEGFRPKRPGGPERV